MPTLSKAQAEVARSVARSKVLGTEKITRAFSEGDVFRAIASVKGVESGKEYVVIFVGANVIIVQSTSSVAMIELADWEFERVAGSGIEREINQAGTVLEFDDPAQIVQAYRLLKAQGASIVDYDLETAINLYLQFASEEDARDAKMKLFSNGIRAKVPVNIKSERDAQKGNPITHRRTLKECYADGYNAANSDETTPNPYYPNTPEYAAWQQGFDDNLRGEDPQPLAIRDSKSSNPIDRLARTIANAFKQFVGERGVGGVPDYVPDESRARWIKAYNDAIAKQRTHAEAKMLADNAIGMQAEYTDANRAYVAQLYAALAKMERAFSVGDVVTANDTIQGMQEGKQYKVVKTEAYSAGVGINTRCLLEPMDGGATFWVQKLSLIAELRQLEPIDLYTERGQIYVLATEQNKLYRFKVNRAQGDNPYGTLQGNKIIFDTAEDAFEAKRDLEVAGNMKGLTAQHGDTLIFDSPETAQQVQELLKNTMRVALSDGIEISADHSEKPTLRVIREQGKPIRWLAVASSAVLNRQGEIDSTKLFDSFVENCERTKQYPILDFFHLRENVRLGQADLVARDGALYLATGTFDETPIAQSAIKTLEAEPKKWGLSISYLRNGAPDEFLQISPDIHIPVFTRGINDFISVLPATAACDWFTAIGITRGGIQMNKKVRDALAALVGEELANQFAGQIDDTNREITDKRLVMRAAQVQREGAAYEEGKAAFATDPESVNPYPADSPEALEWQKGFDEAKAGAPATAPEITEESVTPVRSKVPVDIKTQRAESPEWQSAYDKTIADGKTPEEAKKAADEAIAQSREIIIDEKVLATLTREFTALPEFKQIQDTLKSLQTLLETQGKALDTDAKERAGLAKRLDVLEVDESKKRQTWQDDLPRTTAHTTIVRQRAPAVSKPQTAAAIAQETLSKIGGPRFPA